MNTFDAMKAGAIAFAAGRDKAPCLNQVFSQAAFADAKSGNLILLLDAYLRGWTTAMLAKDAPISTMPSVLALEKIMAAE